MRTFGRRLRRRRLMMPSWMSSIWSKKTTLTMAPQGEKEEKGLQ